jgi:hypothetical protein
VHSFYASLAAGEIDDVSTIPRASTGSRAKSDSTKATTSSAAVDTSGAGGHSKTNKDSSVNTADKKISQIGSSSSGDQGTDSQVPATKQYWEATSAGATWFQLCSALPGLNYLSRAPSTQQEYELKPTMRNVCAALSMLLGLTPQGSSALSNEGISLKQLEEQWNHHIDDSVRKDGAMGSAKKIVTSEGIVRFRAPFSDTEMINREVGKISYIGGRHALEIELESAHQLATVKHRLGASKTAVWSTVLVSSLQRSYEKQVECVLQNGEMSTPETDIVALSALLGDRKLHSLLAQLTKYKEHRSAWSSAQQSAVDALVVDALTAARWGEERLSGSDIGETGNGGVLSVTDASLTSAEAKLRQQAAIKMTLQALELVTYCADAATVAHAVRWMLQEAPTDVTAEQVVDQLLHVPGRIRESAVFQSMLRTLGPKENGAGLLLQKALSFGTVHCPFTSAGLAGWASALAQLSARDKARLCVMYAKFRMFS